VHCRLSNWLLDLNLKVNDSVQQTKRLLMVTFQFPPFAGSSGIQRTLRFAQQLPSVGWQPIVLTAHPRAYQAQSLDLLSEIPEGIVVKQAFAVDTGRHFALFGRYPAFLARPDRWIGWRPGAVFSGLCLIRRYRPQVIWSTYPIATAHLVAQDLHRLSGLPWVADFRDPMAQDGYPGDSKTWRSFKSIEETALHRANRSVFTTPGAAKLYRERYPNVPVDRVRVIENGYDEESFTRIHQPFRSVPLVPGKLTLLHSGVIYPSERDPSHLFAALGQLAAESRLDANRFCLRLRAPGHEQLLHSLVRKHKVDALVDIAPAISYHEALVEMMSADGLVILQASNCNQQIPAKVYEYLRAGRPILGLTDPAGDTALLLRQAGINNIARLDSIQEIVQALPAFLERIRSGRAELADPTFVANASRSKRTEELARLLDELHG
jgi:glycosyltransferase involved in cell wall biosynthesis